ncbi:MAG: DMT family transporter [Hyphomicrobiales bacterium]|nr:MAG: DMT family transporter [Hyphomicrobiales bacterium]
MSAPSLSSDADAASLRGMALGVAAYSLFAVHDAVVKGVIFDMPVVQILFVRSVVITLICLAIGRRKMLRDLVASPNKPMLALRAILMLAAWCLYYPAGQQLKLAEMTTLYYVAPAITIVLAVIFLKEQLTLARVAAAAIGFFGVIVAANPAGISLELPAFMALTAAFLWAVAMILMRQISKNESSLVIVFSVNASYIFVLGLIAVPLWQVMDLRMIASVLAIGVIGGLAQFVLIEAARQVPASVLGTVEYSALVWSFVFGFLFWREEPALVVYLGAALVIASGFVLAWSERKIRGRIVDTP